MGTGRIAADAGLDSLGRPKSSGWLDAALLAALSGVLFVWFSWSLPLTDPDESRCALIVREMLRGGDWIIPRLKDQPYLAKPASFFWLAAAAQVLTGEAELAGRLVAAIAGWLCVLATYAFARRMAGRGAGLLAGAVLATSLQFIYMAHWYRMDMPFCAAMWAAIWWFRRGQARLEGPGQSDSDAARAGSGWRQGGWIGFYVFAGVATLLKGPGGLALPAVIIATSLLLRGKLRRLLGFFNPWGIALFVLIAAPWYVAAALREPTFLREFFVNENIGRYAGGSYGHHWSGILYIPVLLGGLMPWTVLLPGAVIRFLPRRLRELRHRPDQTLLWLTTVLTVLLFSFSGTKMASYILPAFPPLAVLIGLLLAHWCSSGQPRRLMVHGLRALLAAVTAIAIAPLAFDIWRKAPFAWSSMLPLPLMALLCLAVRRLMRPEGHASDVLPGAGPPRRWRTMWVCVAGIVLVWVFFIGYCGPGYCDMISSRSLARQLPPAADRARIFYWPDVRLSFQFYLNCPNPIRYLPQEKDRLVSWLEAGEASYGLVHGQENLRELRQLCGWQVKVVAQTGDRWLVEVRNEPASQPGAATGPGTMR